MRSEQTLNIQMSHVGLLTIAFVVLKLCKVIDWSWWWVLSPLWIGIILAIVVCFVLSLVVYYKQQDNGIDEFEDSYREIDDKIEALRNRIDEINKKKAKH